MEVQQGKEAKIDIPQGKEMKFEITIDGNDNTSE
jgi:hypothetical protein